MAIDLGTVTLPAYKSEAEVYAAKPWLKAGSVTRNGTYWQGTDEDGFTGLVGRMDDSILHEAGGGYRGTNTGLSNFMLSKTGEFYESDGAAPVDASLFGGGLVPLPGLGILGNGKYNWLLWALLGLGLVLVLSKGGRRPAVAR